MPHSSPDLQADVLVAGAGAAGLSAAIALAQAGFSVVCVGELDRRANGRTVALFEASLRFYKSIGLWPQLRGKAAPLEKIRMVDATGARFAAPEIEFAAREIGLSAFGENVENNVLVEALAETARRTPGLVLIEAMLGDMRFNDETAQAELKDGRSIEAKMVVAADGRASISRAKAKIPARTWTYPQIALTALLSHARPHHNVSTEFHTRSGPCTLVPLRPLEGRPNRSSLVWLMSSEDAGRRRALDPARLGCEVERQVDSLLGAMEIEGSCGFFPMAAMSVRRLFGHRIALIGEAAHVFPPLAAQGLNLSLRDIAALVETLEDAQVLGQDIGEAQTLRAYARARAGDVFLRTNGVDILNRSLLIDFMPLDVLRSAGVFAFSMLGPLRRALMREGVLTHIALPRLMQPRRSLRFGGATGAASQGANRRG